MQFVHCNMRDARPVYMHIHTQDGQRESDRTGQEADKATWAGDTNMMTKTVSCSNTGTTYPTP